MRCILHTSAAAQGGSRSNPVVLLHGYGSTKRVACFYQVLLYASYTSTSSLNIITLYFVAPTQQPTLSPTSKAATSIYVCSDFSNCCQGNSYITFTSSLTRISDDAFTFCTNIQIVVIPSSITVIGGRSFYGCSSLTSIVLPDSVVAIDSYAFYNCPFACIHWDPRVGRSISPNNALPTYKACVSSEFTFTGNVQPYVVPDNVFQLKVDLYGASGGKGYPADMPVGEGGIISSFISVTPGQTLYLVVGGAGGNTGVKYGTGIGGYNGGGSASGSSYVGGGGGGCSDIRLVNGDIDSRIIVAGGGGASGPDFAGGSGGSDIGASGSSDSSFCPTTATGGSQYGPGASVSNSEGSKGQGGNGIYIGREHVGGGGGCGFWGGGGGCCENGAAGGSSYSAQNITIAIINNTLGGNMGDGKIIISYNQPSNDIICSNSDASGCCSLCTESPCNMTISSSVTNIGRAFQRCTLLTSIIIPSSIISIGSSAFDSCSSLISVIIPTSVTSIGNEAFMSCTSLTSVTIPTSVTSIGDGAFIGCSSLTSVTIPDSVTTIGMLIITYYYNYYQHPYNSSLSSLSIYLNTYTNTLL